ncbi:hypothetical protein EMIT0324P_60257 [Pseudomonas chlororaphis]
MGALRAISSLLVNRRRNRCRCLADHDHGRAQQATVELIALLEHLENAVRFDVGTFLHGHRLVLLSVERFAMRIDRFQLITLQGVLEHLQGQFDTFTHRTNALVVRAGQLKTALEAVDHRQQVASKTLESEFMSFFYILLGTAADVLQIGRNTQCLILSASQLLFEHLHTSRQIFARSLRGLIGVEILRIQRLFVSHTILLSISSVSSTHASAPVYGVAFFRFKGRALGKNHRAKQNASPQPFPHAIKKPAKQANRAKAGHCQPKTKHCINNQT